MKNTLKEKFKNNVLVKPLYRKLKNGNKIKPKLLIDSRVKLDGNGFSVKRNIINTNGGLCRQINRKEKIIYVYVSRENENKKHLFNKVIRKQEQNRLRKGRNMLSKVETRKANGEVDGIEDKRNEMVQADTEVEVVQKVTNTWLRLYPLPKLPGESVGSVIFRCIVCQLGLCTILILWTTVWVFLIHYFEGPYETKVSLDFDKEQNQLVIDLATELRQLLSKGQATRCGAAPARRLSDESAGTRVTPPRSYGPPIRSSGAAPEPHRTVWPGPKITPLSPKWRAAIEHRIQEERHLTMKAVSRGARIHPGQYWDLSGTFLFTVYVMTALGFGAPVPQTTWGRTSALIYAVFAVPVHVYLMLNASMCMVVRVEMHLNELRRNRREQRPFVLGRTTPQNEESPNCSRSSEVLKTNRSGVGKKIMRFLCVLGGCRSVTLIGILYYMFGAAAFGLARGNTSLDIALFPLEFTTSGGLDSIKGHVRILYGWYVEGAMMLLSCGLATMRRYSSAGAVKFLEKYRLLESE